MLAEGLLAPAIPSVAARAGGLFLPLAKALCLACGSDPAAGTEKKMGAYLMMTCFLTTTISSGMFITAMAANPLAVNLAAAMGLNITWGGWALSALVPGLVALLVTPALMYVLYPPEVKDTPDAPAKAREELKKLGPLSRDEKITALALGITVVLWIGGQALGVNAVAAALTGLSILLITSAFFCGGGGGIMLLIFTYVAFAPRLSVYLSHHTHPVADVVSWEQCLSDNQAWDTLTWFAALIAMASYLNKYGFIAWFSDKASKGVLWLGG